MARPPRGATRLSSVQPMRALPESAVREACDVIGRGIVAGTFLVEGKLPHETELSEQLGSSRTVIREMTRLLTAKGMLRPVRHFGTAVRHHQHWNLLDPDVALWHEADSPTLGFLLEELGALMQAMLPLAASHAARRFAAGTVEAPVKMPMDCTLDAGDPASLRYAGVVVMALECAGSQVYQNVRDLGLHFARLGPSDGFRDELYARLQAAVVEGRADDARSCAEFLLSQPN